VRLATLLDGYLRSSRDLEVLASPADIRTGQRTSVQPDLFVVLIGEGEHARQWPELPALILAIEILSPGTARVDRNQKRRLYQRERVAEYWIVDLDSRLVERWRPGDERPEILDRTFEWRVAGAGEPLVIDLEAFFDEILSAG
jgi:Uma2 family endonuclease